MTAPRTVLALEFRGVGDTADFGFLAAPGGPVDLVRVDPLVHHIEHPLLLTEHARLILDALPAAPDLVLAYCGTAALGLHICSVAGTPAVLVDPYPVTAADLRKDFARLCASSGIDPAGLLDPEREPDVARWESALLGSRDSMAEQYGGDDEAYELVDDLLDRYCGWLRFLRASMTAGPAATGGGISVITARPHPVLTPLLTAPAAARIHRVEAEGGLLDSPQVRKLLSAAVHGQEGT
ncbi:hypothetical protein [Kitasatospora terrestris]|uniref:Uncharacterized protein n=1 Tax=Kitasatospora terrestris TaxID=258051 RepID=A0ABP9DA71_9ACTN